MLESLQAANEVGVRQQIVIGEDVPLTVLQKQLGPRLEWKIKETQTAFYLFEYRLCLVKQKEKFVIQIASEGPSPVVKVRQVLRIKKIVTARRMKAGLNHRLCFCTRGSGPS